MGLEKTGAYALRLATNTAPDLAPGETVNLGRGVGDVQESAALEATHRDTDRALKQLPDLSASGDTWGLNREALHVVAQSINQGQAHPWVQQLLHSMTGPKGSALSEGMSSAYWQFWDAVLLGCLWVPDINPSIPLSLLQARMAAYKLGFDESTGRVYLPAPRTYWNNSEHARAMLRLLVNTGPDWKRKYAAGAGAALLFRALDEDSPPPTDLLRIAVRSVAARPLGALTDLRLRYPFHVADLVDGSRVLWAPEVRSHDNVTVAVHINRPRGMEPVRWGHEYGRRMVSTVPATADLLRREDMARSTLEFFYIGRPMGRDEEEVRRGTVRLPDVARTLVPGLVGQSPSRMQWEGVAAGSGPPPGEDPVPDEPEESGGNRAGGPEWFRVYGLAVLAPGQHLHRLLTPGGEWEVRAQTQYETSIRPSKLHPADTPEYRRRSVVTVLWAVLAESARGAVAHARTHYLTQNAQTCVDLWAVDPQDGGGA